MPPENKIDVLISYRLKDVETKQDKILTELGDIHQRVNYQTIEIERLKASLATLKAILCGGISSGIILYLVEKLMIG